MAAEIFGAGVDREVHAEIQRPEIKRRRPGIVHDDQRALGMRCRGNRRNVLHFKAQRARRFDKDRACVGLDQPGNGAADERIVIGRGDAEPGEDLVAIAARRPVGAIGDKQMIAGMHNRQQRRRNGCEPRGEERHAGALRPLQFLHGEFECFRRRGTAAAVLIARAVGDEILGARVEDGRGMVDWRVDEAVVGGRIAAARDHARIWMPCRSSAVFTVLVLGHRLSLTSPGVRCAHMPIIVPLLRHSTVSSTLDLAVRSFSDAGRQGEPRTRRRAALWRGRLS